ncbi:heme lyase NrfEFG subunit NrfF [Salmonella enterica]|nr:heme lyase NrfEFG subunit NrfF [Salmonella enterica]
MVLFLITFATHAQVVDTWRFDNPQQQEKALSIASQLRCPQCQNQNLLESNAPVAVSMRHQVYSMVAEGKSEAEITAWMTDRYGDFVRYNPPLNEQTLLLWALPCLLLLLVGAAVPAVIAGGRGGLAGEKASARRRGGTMSQSEHSTAPLRPMPVKRLAAAAVLMVAACIGGYMLTPKWQAVRSEQQRLADPLRDFTNPQTPEAQLSRLQEKIRANSQDSEQWARLGEYYLYRNAYDNALLAYRQALRLRGDNAQLFAALATVLYYQAGQHMTPATREMINKALALDATEVTAQMLLAADAFMQADYAQAVSLWQTLLDANSPRVNRAQLVEAINLAKLLQNRQK